MGNKMKNATIKNLILLGITLCFATSVTYAASERISGKAANFTLKSRTGKNIKLSELRGQVTNRPRKQNDDRNRAERGILGISRKCRQDPNQPNTQSKR